MMGATYKGHRRDAPIKKLAALHGPPILRHLGGGAAATSGPGLDGSGPPPPPRIRQAAYDAVRGAAGGGRRAVFDIPPLDAIRGDLDCRRLAKTLLAAMDKADNGLGAGRATAALREEIKKHVVDDVRSMMAGRVLNGASLGLLGGNRREQDMCFSALAMIVTDHLAEAVLEDRAGAPNKGCDPAELEHASLLSSEPMLFIIIKISVALAKEVRNYISKLDPSKRGDPKIVIIDAVAEAVEKACTRSALRDLQSGGDPGCRERLADQLADVIGSEIALRLADPQAKIDGSEEGE